MTIDKTGRVTYMTPEEISVMSMILLQNADRIDKIAKYLNEEMKGSDIHEK